MKKELLTAILVAIIGTVASFLICNLVVPAIEGVQVKTVSTKITAEVADPDPEVFNYKAINPTVEVYVGDCQDSSSECINEANSGAADANSSEGQP